MHQLSGYLKLTLNFVFIFQTLDLNSEHRRERQADGEKLRRLNAQLETLRQEKERCQLRIHSLEQQVTL